MRNICLYATVILIVGGWLDTVASFSQNGLPNRQPTPQEYIRSTSPLPDGGAIVSQSDRSGNVQTVTMIASLPVANQAPAVGFYPFNGNNGARPSNTVAMPTGSAVNPFGNTTSLVYSYPAATNQPTNTLGFEPVGNRRLTPTMYAVPQLPAPPPILGTTVPGTNNSFAGPDQVFNQMPNQAPFQQAPQPVWDGQQFTFGSFNPPTFSQSNHRVQYSPLISLRNLPPGTYVGQGIIGQPKAYVDGEPVRNLLRYIFP